MKPIYNFLQDFAFPLCVLLGITPYAPALLQNSSGGDVAVIFSWSLTIVCAIVFALCFWWMKSGWPLKKPGYMAALSFGSLLGILIGVSALVGIIGGEPRFYLWFREIPATLLTVGMVLSVAFQFLFVNDDGSISLI